MFVTGYHVVTVCDTHPSTRHRPTVSLMGAPTSTGFGFGWSDGWSPTMPGSGRAARRTPIPRAWRRRNGCGTSSSSPDPSLARTTSHEISPTTTGRSGSQPTGKETSPRSWPGCGATKSSSSTRSTASRSSKNLFFQLVSSRYEHESPTLTSNLPFGGWGGVFGDQAVTNSHVPRQSTWRVPHPSRTATRI